MLPRAMRKLPQQQLLGGNQDEMERREVDVLKSLQREGFVYFQKVLEATHVWLLNAPARRSCRLALPAWFIRDHGDEVHRSVTLGCGASGKVWPARLSVSGELVKPRVTFSGGWTTFVISNDLRAGDRLIFSLKAVSKFVVYIFRRAATAKRMFPRAINASRANSGPPTTRINYCETRNKSELKITKQSFGRQSNTGRPELFDSEGIHEPKFSDSLSDEEFAIPAHFKRTLVEKASSGVECQRNLRRTSEDLVQEDYNNLAAAAADDENGDQKPNVVSEFNRFFSNKRVSPSTNSNSTSNSDHSSCGRPFSNSDYSILYNKRKVFPRRGHHTSKYTEETSAGQQNQCLKGENYNQLLSTHFQGEDLLPTVSLKCQSKSTSSASFSKVLGVCNVHRNPRNGFLELPCKFLRTHIDQIDEVVRLQGEVAGSQNSITCSQEDVNRIKSRA